MEQILANNTQLSENNGGQCVTIDYVLLCNQSYSNRMVYNYKFIMWFRHRSLSVSSF